MRSVLQNTHCVSPRCGFIVAFSPGRSGSRENRQVTPLQPWHSSLGQAWRFRAGAAAAALAGRFLICACSELARGSWTVGGRLGQDCLLRSLLRTGLGVWCLCTFCGSGIGVAITRPRRSGAFLRSLMRGSAVASLGGLLARRRGCSA